MRVKPRLVVAAVAASALAVAAGCWWTLRSAAPDVSSADPVAVAPTKPRPKIRRRRKRAAEASSAQPQAPTKPDAPDGVEKGRLVVHVVAHGTQAPVAGADAYFVDGADREHSAKTDASGFARFDGVPVQWVELLVEAPGFVRELCDMVEATPDGDPPFDLELERGVAVSGVVLDEAGRPLAGASAMATADRDDWLDDSVTPFAEAQCGPDGTFRLATLPADRPSFLQFAAPDYAVRTIEWNPASGGRVEARLVRAGVLRGVVREPSGRAAAGADVKASPARADDKPLAGRTDDKGRWIFDRLAAGSAWTVCASKDGFIDSAPSDVVVREESANATCDLALRRLPRIDVVVLDPRGAPVADAEVTLKDRDACPQVKRCAEGRAQFEVAGPGACRVTVDAPRFVPCEDVAEAVVGETMKVVVRLDAGAAVAGVVVDDAGTPVVGAAVEVSGGTIPGFGAWSRSTTSGTDGAFRVEGLTAGTHAADVAAERHSPWHDDASAPSDGLRVVLPRFARVTMRLRVAPGATPPESVRIERSSRIDGAEAAKEEAKDPIGEDHGPMTWTDGETSAWILPGDWNLTFDAAGFVSTTRVVHADAGEEVSLGDVVLDSGLSVAGVVVDDLGRPVAGASVEIGERTAADDGMRRESAETDADGSFRLGGIARAVSAADVVASVPGGDREEVSNVTLPSEPLRIVLRRNGVVSFRVRDAAGAAARWSVQVDGNEFAAPASGELRLSLAPGKRTIRVAGTDHAPATFEIDVAPGDDVRLPDVVLDAGATLAGCVVDSAGVPVVVASVAVGETLTTSGDGGRFTVAHVAREETQLHVFISGDCSTFATWRPSSPAPFVVVLRRGGMVQGFVHDADGARVSGVDVAIVAKDAPSAAPEFVIADIDGMFSEMVPVGRWTLVVKRGDATLATRDFEVAEGVALHLDILVDR